MADENQENHFSPTHLFFSNREMTCFRNMGTVIEVPKNYCLYEAGNIPNNCYLIEEGRIASFEYSFDGQEYFYNIGEKGTLMFETAVLLGRKLMLNYKTLVPSRLIKIPSTKLIEAVMSDHNLTVELLYLVSQKFLEVNEQIREGCCHTATWQVCNLLLTFADKYGKEYDGKLLISEKVSQQQIANILRINRITVRRALRNLRDMGHIDQVNGYFCIRSQDRLRLYMNVYDTLSTSE